jgi:hypothetical protein
VSEILKSLLDERGKLSKELNHFMADQKINNKVRIRPKAHGVK